MALLKPDEPQQAYLWTGVKTEKKIHTKQCNEYSSFILCNFPFVFLCEAVRLLVDTAYSSRQPPFKSEIQTGVQMSLVFFLPNILEVFFFSSQPLRCQCEAKLGRGSQGFSIWPLADVFFFYFLFLSYRNFPWITSESTLTMVWRKKKLCIIRHISIISYFKGRF